MNAVSSSSKMVVRVKRTAKRNFSRATAWKSTAFATVNSGVFSFTILASNKWDRGQVYSPLHFYTKLSIPPSAFRIQN
jgi:hypothetical protein